MVFDSYKRKDSEITKYLRSIILPGRMNTYSFELGKYLRCYNPFRGFITIGIGFLTAPAIICQAISDTGPKWIAMNVARQLHQTGIILNNDTLEPALHNMTFYRNCLFMSFFIHNSRCNIYTQNMHFQGTGLDVSMTSTESFTRSAPMPST